MDSLPSLSAPELAAELAGPNPPRLLDVREPDETAVSHLEGVTMIPLGQLADQAGQLARDENWVVICRSGGRSGRATAWLMSQGFEQVRNLDGGMQGWAAQVDTSMPVA